MGWRTKFVFILIVYFAGFVTAVYSLAPAPAQPPGKPVQAGLFYAGVKSDEFARSVNSGVHKCIDFSKEAARQTATLLREKLDEMKARSDG